jgi:uncharacterized delta-60 repeat protein
MWFRSSRKPRAIRRPSTFRPCLEALEDRCLLSGGVLDPTFGTAGIVTTPVGSQNFSVANAVAIYPNTGTANDGKVVAAGYAETSLRRVGGTTQANYDFAVARYNLDGSLDRSFGGNGIVTTDLGTFQDEAEDVLVQPDGKVVAAGWTANNQFAVVRYDSDGSLDKSFGRNGEVFTSISGGSLDRAFTMALQPDGKIVVAGLTEPRNTHNEDLALVRYNADGTLDGTFGAGGIVTQHFATQVNPAMDLAIDAGSSSQDPDAGKIVVAAQLNVGPVEVVRYNTNGSLDSSFGSGDVSLNGMGIATAAVAIQSDDRIVVAATSNGVTTSQVGLARLNQDGTPDATFGSGGFVLTPPSSTIDSVTLQPNGQIVVAGHQVGGFVAARYNPGDGSLDTTFGNNGIAISTGISCFSSNNVDVALEPDGRIVMAGTNGSHSSFALARFLATGPQIGSFTVSPNSGNPVASGSNVTLTASGVTDANPGATVTRVAFYLDNNGDGTLEPGTDTRLGYATLNADGTWTLNGTISLPPGNYTLFAQAQDSDGAFGDPLALSFQVL